MLKLRSFFFFLTLFLFIFSSSDGVIVVDLEEFAEPKMVRVIAVNTDRNKLDLYHEISSDSQQEFTFAGYSVAWKGAGGVEIKVAQQQKIEPLLVRSKKTIVSQLAGHTYDFDPSYTLWSSTPIVEKTPTEILQFFPTPREREPVGDSMPITRFNEKAGSTLATLNKEKGALGELVTRLTMLSFGYKPFETKYGGDNGFDGVFESLSKQYLFLTSTKQEKKERTSDNIMKHELNEDKIQDTIQEMKSKGTKEVIKTADLINKYKLEHPNALYKLSQRVMNKGFVQTSVQIFKNKTQYLEEKLKALKEKEGLTEEEILSVVKRLYTPDGKQEAKAQANAGKENVKQEPKQPKAENGAKKKLDFEGLEPPSTGSDKDEISKEYSRNNLYEFLWHLRKEQGVPAIAKKMDKFPNSSQATLQRLTKDKNYAAAHDYSALWTKLTEVYFNDYRKWSLKS